MTRLILALAALVLGATCARAAVPPSLDEGVQRQAIEKAAQLLRDRYVFPDLGTTAADRITQALGAGDYTTMRDPSAFAARVTKDLQAVTHDPHVTVFAEVNAPTGPPRPRTNGGFERVDRLKGNIGYVKIDHFPPLGLFAHFANSAIQALSGTDALIIDLRDNNGGSAAAVTYFASFFFDGPTEVGRLINRVAGTATTTTTVLRTVATPTSYLGKPVYVLTSSATFSGGEELADDLQAQKRALVVGEPTGGGANPGQRFPLIVGRLYLFVPTSRAENPITHSNWEGSGIQPDVHVPAPQALAAAVGELLNQGKVISLAPPPGAPSSVKPIVDTSFMTFRDKPQPGGEAALRKLMADLAAGKPDYENMDPDLAGAARQGAPLMAADLTRLGPVRSVTFAGVDNGSDEYAVRYEHGAAFWEIYRTPEGKLAYFHFAPSS